jgi:hypothetical protein
MSVLLSILAGIISSYFLYKKMCGGKDRSTKKEAGSAKKDNITKLYLAISFFWNLKFQNLITYIRISPKSEFPPPIIRNIFV